MNQTHIAVVLADPRLPDGSKPGARFTEDDFDQVVRLRAALESNAGLRFEYLDDHETLIERLRQDPPPFVLN